MERENVMEAIKSKIAENTRDIDKLAISVEHLATSLESNNGQLSEMLVVMNKQNALSERVDEKIGNMQTDIRTSFIKVWENVHALEDVQSKGACTGLKVYEEKLSTVNKRIANIEGTVRWISRSVVGAVVAAVMGLVIISKGG